MLRRAFCWMVGGLGVGSAFDPGALIRRDEKLPAVDMGVFSIRDANRGGKVSIYVMDGGTLIVPKGFHVNSITMQRSANISGPGTIDEWLEPRHPGRSLEVVDG